MLLKFQTKDMTSAKAAMLVYAIYRSRDKKRGPSGVDMWGQVERFTRSAAMLSADVGEFVGMFKRKMACDTINPRWMETDALPEPNEWGEIIVKGDRRQFMPDIMECGAEEQADIVDRLYRQTSKIILLVRARLEDEKPIEMDLEKEAFIYE